MTLPPINPDNIMLAFHTPTDPNWHNKLEEINRYIRQQEYYIDLEPYFMTAPIPLWHQNGPMMACMQIFVAKWLSGKLLICIRIYLRIEKDSWDALCGIS